MAGSKLSEIGIYQPSAGGIDSPYADGEHSRALNTVRKKYGSQTEEVRQAYIQAAKLFLITWAVDAIEANVESASWQECFEKREERKRSAVVKVNKYCKTSLFIHDPSVRSDNKYQAPRLLSAGYH